MSLNKRGDVRMENMAIKRTERAFYSHIGTTMTPFISCQVLTMTSVLSNMYQLDIILPCFQPHNDWVAEIVQHFDTFKKAVALENVHLIVVNDGSQKGVTHAHVLQLKTHYPDCTFISYQPNRGKGYAVRQGVAATKSPLQIYTDIDFPFEQDALIATYNALKNGANIVIGNRKASYAQQLKQNRRLLSWGSHIFNRYLLGLKFVDTQGGLKGFDTVGRSLFLETTIDRYLFDTEFIMRALQFQQHNKLAFAEIPIATRQGIVLSELGFNVLKKEFKGILKLVSIRIKGLF
jgi:glycosyltransferase involved in cell wall biosynthesis